MIRYKIDVLHFLANAGYTQYKLRQESLLSASAIKSLKDNKPISFDSLDTICRLLGDAKIADIIEYVPASQAEKEK